MQIIITKQHLTKYWLHKNMPRKGTAKTLLLKIKNDQPSLNNTKDFHVIIGKYLY